MAGKIARGSELVKETVPAYPGIVVLEESTAVTVKLFGTPATAGEGYPSTRRVVTGGGTIAKLFELVGPSTITLVEGPVVVTITKYEPGIWVLVILVN